MKSALPLPLIVMLLSSCEQPDPALGAPVLPDESGAEAPGHAGAKTKLELKSAIAEDVFGREPVDPGFAPAHEVAVRNKINSLADTTCLSVICKQTLCRAVVSFRTNDARNKFYDAFLDGLDRPVVTRVSFGSWVVPTADGNPKTRVLWLTKPGCSLPDTAGKVRPCKPEPALPDATANPDAGF